MSDYFNPSSKDRAQRYLALAEMADEKAFITTGTIREGYRRLAEQWRKLAHFAEDAGKDEEIGPRTFLLRARPMGYSRRALR